MRTPLLFLIALSFMAPLCIRAQSVSPESALASLIREVAAESATNLPQGDVLLKLHPQNTHPMITQIFSEELASRGIKVYTAESSGSNTLAIDVRKMNSGTVSRDNSSYFQTASITLGVFAHNKVTNAVLWSREYSRSRTDTLSGAPEYSFKDFTAEEKKSVFESILTPILVSAAAIVIVVLLFTVRGS